MSCRLRPLHTCGVSAFAILHQATIKAQEFNGPIGSMAKRVSTMAVFIQPLLYALQYQFLAILWFIDDRILMFERVAETIFPPSKYVFNRINGYVQIVEIMPAKFDDVTKKMCTIIHQVPYLDSVLLYVMSWLKFWLSISITNTTEKDIVVDKGCNESDIEAAQVDHEEAEEQDPQPTGATETQELETTQSKMLSYKEALEKGTSENPENIHEKDKEQHSCVCTYKEALERGTSENPENKDEKNKEQHSSVSTYKEALEKGTTTTTQNGDEEKNQQSLNVIYKEELDHRTKDEKENPETSTVGKQGTEGGGRSGNNTSSSDVKQDILHLFEKAWLMQ